MKNMYKAIKIGASQFWLDRVMGSGRWESFISLTGDYSFIQQSLMQRFQLVQDVQQVQPVQPVQLGQLAQI